MVRLPHTMDDTRSDRALLEGARAGSVDDYGALCRRHETRILAAALSVLPDLSRAEEVAQDTFVTAWNRLGSLRDPDRVALWMRGIARNLAKRERRRLQRHRREVDPGPESYDVRETLEEREMRALVKQALDALPSQYREPLLLYYWEEQTTRAIAARLDLSENAVAKRLSRGRALIGERLDDFHAALGRVPRGAAAAAALGVIAVGASGCASSSIVHSTNQGPTTMTKTGWMMTAAAASVGLMATTAIALSTAEDDKGGAGKEAGVAQMEPAPPDGEAATLPAESDPAAWQQQRAGWTLTPASPGTHERIASPGTDVEETLTITTGVHGLDDDGALDFSGCLFADPGDLPGSSMLGEIPAALDAASGLGITGDCDLPRTGVEGCVRDALHELLGSGHDVSEEDIQGALKQCGVDGEAIGIHIADGTGEIPRGTVFGMDGEKELAFQVGPGGDVESVGEVPRALRGFRDCVLDRVRESGPSLEPGQAFSVTIRSKRISQGAVDLAAYDRSAAFDGPGWGAPDAPVELVAFASYEDAELLTAVHRLRELYPDELRIVLRHASNTDPQKARAAHAAHAIGGYDRIADLLFAHEGTATDDDLVELARLGGLDPRRFRDALQNASAQEIMERDQKVAFDLGIRIFPTILVNGKRVSPVATWQARPYIAAIDSELGR